MLSKNYSLYAGIIMLGMGAFSLLPGFLGQNASLPPLKLALSYGLFLGTFPMNILNKLALLTFGLAGIISSQNKSNEPALNYCKIVFLVFGTLSFLGIFPATNTLAGFWPLFDGEILAHGLFAILAGACSLADSRSDTLIKLPH